MFIRYLWFILHDYFEQNEQNCLTANDCVNVITDFILEQHKNRPQDYELCGAVIRAQM
jgi:hypothetical protein